MSFVGGKLKLKGGEPLKGVKKKKKEKREDALALTDAADGGGDADADGGGPPADRPASGSALREGYAIERRAGEDRRTEAERRHEERASKLEEERIRKLGQKSHRDRIKEFNEKLANLSEHHDIPKVGPG
jgi:protein FAM32A